MHPAIEKHRDAIAALCRHFKVSRLEVFGSAARSVDFDPATSDADFLVEFASPGDVSALRQFFGLAEALRTLLNRPVDLAERRAIRNPYLLADIDDARELIYAA